MNVFIDGRWWSDEEIQAEGEALREKFEAREKRAHAREFADIGFLHFKEAADGHMIVTGVATSSAVDRMGDVVEPDGAVINLPIPFLLQHDAGAPLGQVKQAKRTAAGIEIVATVLRGMSDRIDEAARLIGAGLYSGLSIGFQSIEAKPIPGGGMRFLRWELLEISAVSIPANPEGRIAAAKQWTKSEAGALDGKTRKVIR